ESKRARSLAEGFRHEKCGLMRWAVVEFRMLVGNEVKAAARGLFVAAARRKSITLAGTRKKSLCSRVISFFALLIFLSRRRNRRRHFIKRKCQGNRRIGKDFF
ncbi:MAG TPA: hypothetical protein PK012_18030, partial [Blastocatellia bacterium]|nr:hypothetical protein [Blastocatellia bacterium]